MEFLNTDFLKSDEIKLVVDRMTEEDPEKSWAPAYHFHICDLNGTVMGACVLRVGYSEGLYYGGHIGYSIHAEYRGNHYAAKACELLFSLARRHGMEYLYITCNPDNPASRKTCEYLQGEFLGIEELPQHSDMRINRGESRKCIYRFRL